MNLEQADIKSLQQWMCNGELTSVELCQFYLERIETYDRQGPVLNSVIELNPDGLEQAEQFDLERSKNGFRGPLHGIPILIKDNIDTADRMATSAGSLALEHSYAKKDAFLVRKLRDAGAVLLGKTNLSEWSNFRSNRSISGWSSRGGQTRNPYDPLRNPCGSSSGSAVAVAAGFCAAAIGTETDGSILGPSSRNGVVGLKPNVGRISRQGLIPISHSQDTPGPLTRKVADASLLLEVLEGKDPQDPATALAPGKSENPEFHIHSDRLEGIRIGVARNLYHGDSRMEQLLDDAVRALIDLGAVVKDSLYLDNTMLLKMPELEVLLHEFKLGINAYLGNLEDHPEHPSPPKSLKELITFNQAHQEQVMPFFAQELFEKAERRGDLSSEIYLESLKECRRLSRQQGIDAFMQKHGLDAFIAPTSGPAWLTDSVNGDPVSIETSFTPSAVAGYPGISVPLGFISGLPVGLSFYGGAWSERMLLRCAHAFENATKAQIAPEIS